MNVLAQLPEIIGFFSYSREDDLDSEGALSTLRRRIQSELRGQLGRSEKTLRLFQDTEAIAPGMLWENQISLAIRQCSFFIPIVTPRVIRSKYCHSEFRSFLEREKEFGRSDLVFPIIYIDVTELKDERRWREDVVLNCIGQRQYVDWSNRRFELDTPRFRNEIVLFAKTIVRALEREVPEPIREMEENAARKLEETAHQAEMAIIVAGREVQSPKGNSDARERESTEPQAQVAAEQKRWAEANAAHEPAAEPAQEETGTITGDPQRASEERDHGTRSRAALPLLTVLAIAIIALVEVYALMDWGNKTQVVADAQARACDLAAGDGQDADRNTAVAGVALEKIDTAVAVPACRKAVQIAGDGVPPRVLYELGRALAKQGSFEEARDWYEKAVGKGSVAAMQHLAELYEKGLGVTQGVRQDYNKAKALYERAADAGHADAMNNLGWFYENGLGGPPDYIKAKKLYEKAADAGNTNAMNNLGRLYEVGLAIDQDYNKAKVLYEKAADAGNMNAVNSLGQLFVYGLGATQDYYKAKDLFEKAADAGNTNAMSNLGLLYETGHGVGLDYGKAKSLYENAAALGNNSARYNAERLSRLRPVAIHTSTALPPVAVGPTQSGSQASKQMPSPPPPLPARAGSPAVTYRNDLKTCGDSAQPEMRISACTRVIESGGLGSDRGKAFYGRADQYSRNGDSDRAIGDLTDAIRLGDANVKASAYRDRAILFSRSHQDGRANADFDAARAAYSDLIRLNPNNLDHYFQRAYIYKRQGNNDGCIAELGTVIQLENTNDKAFAARADCYEEKKDYDRAIADYSEAIRLRPSYSSHRFYRALIYHYYKADADAAIGDLNEALRLDPGWGTYLVVRGRIYASKGQTDKALADYRAALTSDPNDQRAREGIKQLDTAPAPAPAAVTSSAR